MPTVKEIEWEFETEWVGRLQGVLGEIRIVLAPDLELAETYDVHTSIRQIPIHRVKGLAEAKRRAQEIVNRHLLLIALM